jgi:carbamoyl-phosphate synthase large subunit
VSVANRDKRAVLFPVKRLADLGFEVLATEGHRGRAAAQRRRGDRRRQALARHGDDVVREILAGEVDLILNTPFGVGTRKDGYEIRTAAVARGRPVHHDGAGSRGLRAGHRGAGARRHRPCCRCRSTTAHPPRRAGGTA